MALFNHPIATEYLLCDMGLTGTVIKITHNNKEEMIKPYHS